VAHLHTRDQSVLKENKFICLSRNIYILWWIEKKRRPSAYYMHISCFLKKEVAIIVIYLKIKIKAYMRFLLFIFKKLPHKKLQTL